MDLMKQEWSKEKEHLSPISVLDCPFEDEEEMKSHSMINSFFEGCSHISLNYKVYDITKKMNSFTVYI